MSVWNDFKKMPTKYISVDEYLLEEFDKTIFNLAMVEKMGEKSKVKRKIKISENISKALRRRILKKRKRNKKLR